MPKAPFPSEGFSLVEVILASSIFALVTVAFVGVFLYGQESTVLSGTRSQAVFLADEGLEALKNIRDAGFGGLPDGTHGLAISGGQWLLSGTQDITGVFTRQITISSVDAKRKDVTSTVTWQQNLQRTGIVALTSRLTNWIASTGIGNWALPSLESIFNLTAGNSGNGTAGGISIAVAENRVYLGRVNSSGREFYIFDVSNPAAPVLLGQRDLAGTPNDIVINGSYAYIASTDNAQELQIIDVSDPAAIDQAGKLTVVNLTAGNSGNGTADAMALTAAGNYLYMIRDGGDEFLIFNLSDPSNPGNPAGRTALTGAARDVAVSGSYAYAASTDNAAELQIVDISNPLAPARVQVFNLASGNANADAESIAVANNHVFIGRLSSTAPELYAINVANPLAPSLADTLETAGSILSIAIDSGSGYIFLATTDAANDFKVVDGSVPAALTLIGQLNLAASPVELDYDMNLDRAFITSSADGEELQIIAPQ